MAIELNRIRDFPIKEFPFPRALLGVGAHDILGVEAKGLGFRRTLLVTTGLRGSGIIEELTGKIEYQGIEVVLYDKVESNPKDYNCMDAAALYQREQCDSIISIGGGSSHDAAKGARVVIAHDGRNINEFEGFAKSTNMQNPPHIAVSTTAGTGSETTWAYVVTDTSDMDNPKKWVGFDDAVVCTLALDDPLLYYSCPQHFTAYCGFDVLAHGTEPYVSRLDFEASLGNALYTIELVGRYLREAVYKPRNLLARSKMMSAQYIAAQAFNSGGLGIIHSASHAVSAYFDTHHGLNNAIALPRVWEYNLPSRYQRYAKIAAALGVDTTNMTTAQAADAAVEEGGDPAVQGPGHPGELHLAAPGHLRQEPDEHRQVQGRRGGHPRRRRHRPEDLRAHDGRLLHPGQPARMYGRLHDSAGEARVRRSVLRA